MRRLAVICVLVAAGCQREPTPIEDHHEIPIHRAEPAPPSDRECALQQLRVQQLVHSAYLAKQPRKAERDAIAEVARTSPSCRRGSWYLGVARLLELELDVGVSGLRHPDDALARALEQPDDVEVLARVAQASALGHPIQAPADACARARVAAKGGRSQDQDLAHYVCARGAIAAGDGAGALAELESIGAPSLIGDIELARAQAAARIGDRVAARRAAGAAIAMMTRGGQGFLLAPADRDAVVRIAGTLAR